MSNYKKKRGDKNPIRLTPEGYIKIVHEREHILKVKLPEIREELQKAKGFEKEALEREKKFMLGRVLLLGQWINNSQIIEPTPIDLSKVSTSELHAELVKREGVREIIVTPEESLPMTKWEENGRWTPFPAVQGPARILINED
ncbi:BC1881 family protein [Aneurinibacillus aneurinilyticus]|uniref:BC1881 family protein n=1 Tax=Aneurinibacillus aneurinilyticus TaxID=1391 RepID=UPI002E23BA68|nr:BC1881 family protein [Aneurinibacillus aneurinilyticus]